MLGSDINHSIGAKLTMQDTDNKLFVQITWATQTGKWWAVGYIKMAEEGPPGAPSSQIDQHHCEKRLRSSRSYAPCAFKLRHLI